MADERVTVFLGGPNECGHCIQRIDLLLQTLAVPFAERCEIKSYYWNSPTDRTVTDTQTNLQKRIDGNPINPKSCDLMIMLFHKRVGSPCTYGEPPKQFPSWSAVEIEAARDRPDPPKLVVLRDDLERVVLIDSKMSKREVNRRLKERDENARATKALDDFFHALKLADRVQLIRFQDQLERSLSRLLYPLINEILAGRKSPTPEPVPPSKATVPPFEGYPYRGLDELEFEHGDIFFGREEELGILLSRLKNPNVRLQFLHGPSGVGKSSLLKAGLLNRIIRHKALGDEWTWSWSLFRPSESNGDPFTALVMSLLSPTASYITGDRNELASALKSAAQQGIEPAKTAIEEQLLSRLSPDPHHGLIIAVNQFEELWTMGGSMIEPFLNFLAAAEANPRIRIFATIRDDLLGNFAGAPQIAPLLQKTDAPLALPILSPVEQLDAIIRKPGAVVVPPIEFEDGFVARVIADAARDFSETALPIVAFMLRALREKNSNDGKPNARFCLADYEALGELKGVIAKLVEKVRAPRPDLLEILFHKLADVQENNQTITRAVPRSELVALDPAMAHLVDSLSSKARVLHVGEKAAFGDALVRLQHATLFEQWPDLKDWVARNRLYLSIRNELERDAQTWARRGRRTRDIKLRPERLDEVLELMKEKPAIFADRALLDDYLRACGIRREQDRLISSVKGGHVTAAAAAMRKLLNWGVNPLLERQDRGTEPHQLRPPFWAAITGDDRTEESSPARKSDESSIFEGPDGKVEMERTTSRGMTPLFWAALASSPPRPGQPTLVRKLIANGADAQKLDDDGGNILHVAAVGGNLETFKYLVEDVGLDPLKTIHDGTPPIVWAMQERHAELVAYLSEKGQSFDFKTKDGWNALTEAVRADDAARVEELIDQRHQDPNYGGPNDYSLLHIASYSERSEKADVATLLIERYGVDILARDKDGNTPLHHASYAGKLAAIDLLLKTAKTRNQLRELLDATRTHNATALHDAADSGHPGATEKLIEAGANVDAVDDGHCVPLIFAALRGDRRSAQLLLDKGANPNIVPSNGWCALHYASDDGDLDMVERLIKAPTRADLNLTIEGWTPLMIAARKNHEEVVKALLDAGADASLTNTSEQDVVQVAHRFGHAALVKTIMEWAKDKPQMADVRKRQATRERHAASQLSTGRASEWPTSFELPQPSPLTAAAGTGDLNETRTLLSAHMDAAPDALQAAAVAGHTAVVDLLLAQAATAIDKTAIANAAMTAAVKGRTATVHRLIAAGAPKPLLWRRPRSSDAAWFLSFSELDATAAKALAPDLAALSLVGDAKKRRLRQAPLEFLPGSSLLAIEDTDTPGQNEQFAIIRPDKSLAFMDWTNEPIYNLIETGPSDLTGDKLFTYVRFFFHFVRGQLGRFIFVEDPAHVPWSSGAKKSVKAKVNEKIEPMRILKRTSGRGLLFGTVVFKNALFTTEVDVVLGTRRARHNGAARPNVGLLELKNEKLLLEDLPIDVDLPPGPFG